MESLIRQRGITKGKITRTRTFLDSVSTTECVSINEVKRRLYLLEEAWGEYNNVSCEIIRGCKDDEEASHSSDLAEVETKYITTVAGLTDLLEKLEIPTQTGTVVEPIVRADVKLPALNLPTFSGDYLEWTEFQDLFTSMVHDNQQISDSQKLQYLKGVLRGEAAEVIKSVKTTNANYCEAWKLLSEAYQDTRKIKMSHVEKLFNQPAMSRESCSDLRQLLNTTVQHVTALKVLGVPVQSWDLILVHIVSLRMDKETRKEWERSICANQEPTFEDIRKFLINHCKMLDSSKSRVSEHTRKQSNQQRGGQSGVRVHHTVKPTCANCNRDHHIYRCEYFLAQQPRVRAALVKEKKLCFNCLRLGHSSKDCKSNSTCRKCNKSHNTLLHFEQASQQPEQPILQSEQQQTSLSTHLNSKSTCCQVLLPTVLLNVRANGSLHVCRAVLDSASEGTLCTEALVQRLGLRRVQANPTIEGTGGMHIGNAKGCVTLQLESRVENFSINVKALILSKLSGLLPKREIIGISLEECASFQLADPEFYKPGQIDILIGCDYYYQIIKEQLRLLSNKVTCAHETHFGWVLGGPAGNGGQTSVSIHFTNVQLLNQMRVFWELEEVKPKVFKTPEEKKCEENFSRTHTRDGSGRYVVAIPLKDKVQDLGNSVDMARRRLWGIERRLQASQDNQEQYVAFMAEYEAQGHMEKIEAEENVKGNYLPHHFVLKEDSTTTKLRVVFDASAKTTSGLSLNDVQMVGPKLQDDIFAIILRFRSHRYAVSADIEKMYRQINVREEDRDYQRILWRAQPDHPIEHYRLNTVTYGTASGPYLATKVLQQLSVDEREHSPRSAEIIERDFYMDDVMTGGNSISETQQLCQELLSTLRKGGFELRKWSSNSDLVLEVLPEHLRANSPSLTISQSDSVKTLGLWWDTYTDSFVYCLWKDITCKVTKRSIISDISRLYDPLGWLSPVVVKAKIIIQKLWLSNVQWDENIPQALESEWKGFKEDLPNIQTIKVPRFIIDQEAALQLHGFCDASLAAYGAVLYVRAVLPNKIPKVRILCAKTKVAPLKPVSLPRMELCAAVLLARLLVQVQSTLRFQITAVYLWSDSTVTLAWLRSEPRRWKTFVANRSAEIQELTSPSQWHHVPTKCNPADVASRGMIPSKLESASQWWCGPEFLLLPMESWPAMNSSDVDTKLEERKQCTTVMMTYEDNLTLTDRYSSLRKLQRIVAWCFRFVHNLKQPVHLRRQGELTVQEFESALLAIVKQVQQKEFKSLLLSLNKETKMNNEFQALSPFVDEQGYIRVGGRLRHSQESYDTKFPYLLPKRNNLTKLIIQDLHERLLHPGAQLLLTTMRQKFWIVDGRSTVRYYTHQCLKCFRDRANNVQQFMGDLPATRVEEARPFARTGVDFGGPFQIRAAKGRGQKIWKAYMALFVCMSTKAVHIEVVSDLTTQAVIAALRRFCARRGQCKEIFSDNATNFQGANSELKELYDLVQKQSSNQTILSELTNLRIKWHFIPPRAPHFGGLWEANVKSAKQHLRRIVGKTTLTFEELATVFTQIEACLNSRPLCPLSSDPNDCQALTPGHFLIGEPLVSIADPNVTEIQENRLSRWQVVQRMVQSFWKRWHQEYLTNLQQRYKWQHRSPNVEIGTLVLVKEDNISPLQWIKVSSD